MRINQEAILTNGDMSQASLTSIGIDLQMLALASIQAVWTGSPVGTMILQVSNDKVDPVINNADPASKVVNWTTYTGSSQSITTAGDFMFNILNPGYRWIRLKYTKISGTGSLSATLVAKGA